MEELIRRAKAYDGDAFVELMEQHRQSMYKIAFAYLKREEDAADAVSETILDCFEHLDALKEPKYFTTWLVRILINNCKDLLKQNQRVTSIETLEGFEPQGMSRENREFLDYLEPLPKEEQLLMILYYVWGFRTREIAQIVNQKESTVKSRLLRGRAKIRQTFFPELVTGGNL
ncbi:MAG: sigma-70 family RNA polymerase sigma factor [Lachnospiraceae bacterium]|jgi:RNA polymerase sigma factor (sigma-70 family)|nr:sigma-70 family RNA polymerase sigma factor [Lachnospiraceae bacterium]MCI9134905.1 sigma-70 family RNA polymerase sigma factor [Lachnospiraceae bacterium]